MPLDSENNKLEGYLEQTKEKLCHLRFQKPKPNMTKEERRALNDFTKNTDLVIKKPDKTRGICIMSDPQYRKVGFTHLASDHYEQIPFDKTHDTAQLVHDTLIDMYNSNYINEDTCDFLDPYNSEIRTSYPLSYQGIFVTFVIKGDHYDPPLRNRYKAPQAYELGTRLGLAMDLL